LSSAARYQIRSLKVTSYEGNESKTTLQRKFFFMDLSGSDMFFFFGTLLKTEKHERDKPDLFHWAAHKLTH